ncbi:MAG: hypothetical protein ABJO72_09935 [Hyphomicrobiales bacterium]
MFGYRKLHVVILARLWNLFSGLLFVVVSSNVFTAIEQGIVYTFLGLAAAQFFFDLGVGVVLANIVGRFTPNHKNNTLFDDQEIAHVRSVINYGLKWSLFAGILLFAMLAIIGIFLFSDNQYDIDNLQTIWVFYAVLVAFSMSFHMFLRLFEGLGFVVEAAISRSIQSFMNIALIFGLSIFEVGLGSLPIALFVALLIASLYFVLSNAAIRDGFSRGLIASQPINWKKDIWPFQSKMAIIWIASYIIYQSQTPILFSLAGAEAAGFFGIANQLFLALNTSANIFLTYNIKDWTRLSVNGDMQALNKSFVRTLALTVGIAIVGCIAIIGGIYVIRHLGWQMAGRFPDFSLLILFAIAACFNQIFFCLGYYFRAQGREPLWWVSVIAAIAILIVPVVLWQSFDISAAIWSFLFVSVIILSVLSSVYSLFLVRKNKQSTPPQKEAN